MKCSKTDCLNCTLPECIHDKHDRRAARKEADMDEAKKEQYRTRRREYMKEYRKNPEVLERQKRRRREYVAQNRDHINAVKREWYRRNRYRLSAKNRERYANDPEYRAKVLEKCHKDYADNLEKRREHRREYWRRYGG